MPERTRFRPALEDHRLEDRLVLTQGAIPPAQILAHLPLHGFGTRYLGVRHVSAVISEQFGQFQSSYISALQNVASGGSSSDLGQTTDHLSQQLDKGVTFAISTLRGPTSPLYQRVESQIQSMVNQLKSTNQQVENRGSSSAPNSTQDPLLSQADNLIVATQRTVVNEVRAYGRPAHLGVRSR